MDSFSDKGRTTRCAFADPGQDHEHAGLVELLKWFDPFQFFGNMSTIFKASTPAECFNEVHAGDEGCQLAKHRDPGQNPKFV